MTAPTIAVTCVANDQNGNPVAGAVFTARLDSTEVYQGFVVPERVQVVANASGIAVLNLWPNALGVAGSLYRVTAVNPDTGRKFLDTTISVPNSPCNLHEILVQAPYPTLDAAAQTLVAAQGALAAATATLVSEDNTAASAAAALTSQSASAGSATAAAGSATAASAAQVAASASATAAATSATSAGNSQTAAAASATSALGSATTATTKAGESLASANASETSKLASGVSAAAAAASELASANSAATATGQASVATTKAAEALASATSAAGSAGSASASQTAAAASAGQAAASATTAGLEADEATAQQVIASAKATDASGSATAALASQTAAAASATAAGNSETAAATSATTASTGATTATTQAGIATTKAAEAAAQASLASGYAASVAQQDLSGATATALHRSPNAVTAMFVYDTGKDSDGGAWTEKCQHTSWYNEAINGKWLGPVASEAAAREVAGATTGDYYQATTDGKFYRLWKNQLRHTNVFSNAVWNKNQVTLVENTIAAPVAIGGMASSVYYAGNNRRLSQTYSAVSGTTYCFSAYLKAGVQPLIWVGSSNYNNFQAGVDLTSGVVSNVSANVSASTTAESDGWFRVSIRFTATTTTPSSVYVGLGGQDASADSTNFFYIAGAQLEVVSSIATTATTYEAKTTDGSTTETFRGNKRDFPRLSAIVAEAGNVTVYDLTEPGRPMAFRFVAATNNTVQGTISSVAGLNGNLCIGSNSGMFQINFPRDSATRYSTAADQFYKGTIAQRGGANGYA